MTQLCEGIMTEIFETCTPRDPVSRAAQIMHSRNTRFVPVVEGPGVVGLITDLDVIGRVVAQGLGSETTIGAVMPRRPVITVMPEDSVQTAWQKMTQGNANRVLVVGRHGIVMGSISRSDLINLQRSRRHTTKRVAADSGRHPPTGRTGQ